MILSGHRIQELLGTSIIIDPFNPAQLNPNSYNLSLHDELFVYKTPILDMKSDNALRAVSIPPEGLTLKANLLYLGRTQEYTETHDYVPMLEGRSSIGRLGLFIHVSAGFGDVGFAGYWTLEMHCVQPVTIYPFVQICQIFYHSVDGSVSEYKSKYQGNKGVQPSLLYQELRKNSDTT